MALGFLKVIPKSHGKGGKAGGTPHDLTDEESQIQARLQSRLTRPKAAAYLKSLGFEITANRLSKLAVEGGGPEYTQWGKKVYYYPDALLAWAKARERVVKAKPGAGRSK